MRQLALCPHDRPLDDPLLTIVKQQYGARLVAMPRGDIELLGVLVDSGEGRVKPWGPLGILVTGSPPLNEELGPSAPTPVADLSGTRSGTTDIGLGLTILGAALNAFGLPVPGISAQFRRCRFLSFKFSGVTRRSYVARNIGHALEGRVLSPSNAANAFIEKQGSALLIDSVFEAPTFASGPKKSQGSAQE